MDQTLSRSLRSLRGRWSSSSFDEEMNDVETTMTREIALFTELGAHPDRHHGVILIPRAEISALVGQLLDRGTRILGLDGFRRNPDNKIQPFMEFSPDYSDAQPSQQELESFLSGVPDTITHFEVVVDI
jgi:hypothetical protein